MLPGRGVGLLPGLRAGLLPGLRGGGMVPGVLFSTQCLGACLADVWIFNRSMVLVPVWAANIALMA